MVSLSSPIQAILIYVGAVLLLVIGGLWARRVLRATPAMRRSVEAQRERRSTRLALALSSAAVGLWRWDAATDEITQDPTLNRMLGLDAVESRARRRDLGQIHPDRCVTSASLLDRAIRERDPYSMQCRVIRPDGSAHWFRVQATPFFAPSGVVDCVVGVIVEITDSRDAEGAVRRSKAAIAALRDGPDGGGSESGDATHKGRADVDLRRTEAKYRELVENANDIMFTADRDGHCLSMNRAGQTIRGYVAGNPLGTRLTELVVPEQADFVDRQIQSVIAGEDVPALEIEVHTTAGTPMTLEVALRPVSDGRSIVGVQGIARDVTARNELEQQRRQANKMDAVGQLAAGVAHDFNNLLTIILGNCELAAPLVDQQDRLKHTITDIRTAAERASSLTGQLLAFSRRQIIQPRVLDLNELVTDVRRMMTRLIREDIDVRFIPGEGLWHVNGDVGQLQQVLINLAVNARDAMPEGGRLTIETQNVRYDQPHVEHRARVPPGDYVLLSVTDTGVGMDENTRERLFEPFFTTKDPGKGTGLGLSTVYGIVKQGEGFIFPDSRPGAGTSFRVLLPRAEAALPPPASEPSRDQVRIGHEMVLLVEDERDVRELLREYLAAQGYEVLSAATGAEAIDLCRTRAMAPAVLVTDIVMPGMSGRALADHLRTTYPDLKVLYVSGYTDDRLVRQGSLPSGTQFLQKPFVLADLAKKIREMVDTTSAA